MSPGADQIERTLEEILSAEEFEGLKDPHQTDLSAIGELVSALLRSLQALIGELRSNHPGLFVLIFLMGLAVLALAAWYGARGAARQARGGARAEGGEAEALKGDPKALQTLAELAAKEGRYLEAVRLMFRAKIIEQALSEGLLERLKDAEGFRRARTYRELVEEFSRARGDKDRARAARLRALAQRLEEGLYAGAALSHEDWQKVKEL